MVESEYEYFLNHDNDYKIQDFRPYLAIESCKRCFNDSAMTVPSLTVRWWLVATHTVFGTDYYYSY